MHVYIYEKYVVYVLNIFIYIIKYNNININTCKYSQNIYCMCVYSYIHNKYTQYTHII